MRAVVEGFVTYVTVHPALARIIVRELTNEAGPGRLRELAAELVVLRERLQEGGGAERAAKQRAQGKMTARERVAGLLDPRWKVEIEADAIIPQANQGP